MKTKRILYLAAALVLAASCTNDEDGRREQSSGTAVEVSAGIGTRASGTSWHAGDAIGLFMLQSGQPEVINGMANRKYVNPSAGATATFSPDGEANTAWYPSGGELVDLIAYYPYDELTIDNGQLTINTKDQANLPKIDLMTSDLSRGHSSEEGKRAANLRFTHRLAKVVVTLIAGEGTEDLDLSTAKVTISGTPGTATYDLYQSRFANLGAITDIEMVGNTGIVIPPGDGGAVTFTVRIGNDTFVATLPADKRLESGKEAGVRMRLNYTKPSIEATIVPWLEGPEADLTALTVGVAPGPDGTPEVKQFKLWRTDEPADVRQYNWDAVAAMWTATPAPFYLENLTVGETLEARHTLGTDALTGVDDVIEARATPLKDDYSIDLKFEHIKARVELMLSTSNDFSVADWSAVEVKILGYGEVFTGNSHTFIMEPGVITAGTTLATIQVNGFTYGAVAGTAIALTPGTTTKVKIELRPTAAGIINVSFEDWGIRDAGQVIALRIYTPPTQATDGNIPSFSLWNTSNPNDIRTYQWEGGSWKSDKPFYQENYNVGESFEACHHYRNYTDPVTGRKDMLIADDTFSADKSLSLAFTHENALLTFNLRSQLHDDAFWKAATVELAFENAGKKTLTGSLEYSFIVGPESAVEDGNLLATIVAGDLKYEVRASPRIAFTAGINTTVDVIINGTEPGMNVGYSPWTNETAGSKLELNGVVKGTDLSALPNEGKVTITPEGLNPAVYRWDGSKLTPIENALYWDNFVSIDPITSLPNMYNFSFHYEPDAVTGIAKDILYQNNVEIAWGRPLAFPNLRHENTEIIVVLKKGSTYPDADWTQATVTLEGFTASPYQLTAKSTDPDLETVPVVVEKNLSSSGKYVSLTLNNVTYRAEIRNLTNIPGTLAGGSSYKLILTLEKTGIGIGEVTIDDFDPVNGSGGIIYNN